MACEAGQKSSGLGSNVKRPPLPTSVSERRFNFDSQCRDLQELHQELHLLRQNR